MGVVLSVDTSSLRHSEEREKYVVANSLITDYILFLSNQFIFYTSLCQQSCYEYNKEAETFSISKVATIEISYLQKKWD